MRTSPVNVVDPTDMAGNERDNLSHIVEEIVESGTIKLDALPEPLRAQLLFALDACAKGQVVASGDNNQVLVWNYAGWQPGEYRMRRGLWGHQKSW